MYLEETGINARCGLRRMMSVSYELLLVLLSHPFIQPKSSSDPTEHILFMHARMANGNRTFPRNYNKSPSVALAVWFGNIEDIDAPQWVHEVEEYEDRRTFYETRGALCDMFASLANANHNVTRSNAIHRWIYDTSVRKPTYMYQISLSNPSLQRTLKGIRAWVDNERLTRNTPGRIASRAAASQIPSSSSEETAMDVRNEDNILSDEVDAALTEVDEASDSIDSNATFQGIKCRRVGN